ncbi:MAG: hypothetical protein ACODAU_02380 [Myxococcota bacterium]
MLRCRVSLAILVALLIPAAGCVDGDSTSVFVLGNAQLDDDCAVQPDTLWVQGRMDTAIARDYVLHLIVRNQILANSSAVGTDPSGVSFTRAEVQLFQDAAGTPVAGVEDAYSVPVSGFVPSAEDFETPGENWVTVPAIPATVRDSLRGRGRATVHLGVTLFGKTNGQIEVETAQWLYLVDICDGCLACVDDEERGTCNPGQENECY